MTSSRRMGLLSGLELLIGRLSDHHTADIPMQKQNEYNSQCVSELAGPCGLCVAQARFPQTKSDPDNHPVIFRFSGAVSILRIKAETCSGVNRSVKPVAWLIAINRVCDLSI